jgi:para-nitrobenzyl esterase
MKKLYFIVLATLFLTFIGNSMDAQCVGIRFRDFMFTDSVKSNVKYGQNYRYNGQLDSLLLDIHFPKSDPAPVNRPLMIIAHGGNFLLGDKSDLDVLPLATDFAKMGYVVASMNYRMGMDGFPAVALDSFIATRAVMRAVQDAHAAVRFFRKSAAAGNPYGIDTSNIFFTGVASGGIMASDLAYLNLMSEFPVWCDTTKPGLNGRIEGLSGNPGYPSNVKAIVSICGGIPDTSWMKAGAIPLCSFHGDQDSTIPYGAGHFVVERTALQTLQGSHSMMLRASHVGLTNCFEGWIGQQDVPEVGSAAYYDTCRTVMRNFIVHFTCGDTLFCEYKNPMGIVEHSPKNASLHCYPNPASDLMTVDFSEFNGEEITVYLYNSRGQEVRKYSRIRDAVWTVRKADLSNGLYLLNAVVKGQRYTSRIVFN